MMTLSSAYQSGMARHVAHRLLTERLSGAVSIIVGRSGFTGTIRYLAGGFSVLTVTMNL
ncbi:hypothetical protein METH_14350 [Leisingera methylohalidivorans DSM 14336]|uniref:Uncharacterized protein n=1 Tax=Leisingera methylohalidivorans DSM 14336 TaxID=999552 RepID=V9VZC6_9RHOB|nr:hypothetical protein METH_14350 [Leisingera methylohalidivorans DSM 14336]